MDTTIEKTVLREICADARQQVWNKFKKPSHVFIVDGTEYKFKSKSAVKKTKVSKKKDRNPPKSSSISDTSSSSASSADSDTSSTPSPQKSANNTSVLNKVIANSKALTSKENQLTVPTTSSSLTTTTTTPHYPILSNGPFSQFAPSNLQNSQYTACDSSFASNQHHQFSNFSNFNTINSFNYANPLGTLNDQSNFYPNQNYIGTDIRNNQSYSINKSKSDSNTSSNEESGDEDTRHHM